MIEVTNIIWISELASSSSASVSWWRWKFGGLWSAGLQKLDHQMNYFPTQTVNVLNLLAFKFVKISSISGYYTFPWQRTGAQNVSFTNSILPRRLTLSLINSQLTNRKVLCFYRVIQARVKFWENEKCCVNTNRRWLFPQVFRVLPNFQECFCNSIETRRTYFLFPLENTAR